MKLTLTITSQKGKLWGHLLFMNDLLIENGQSVAQIKNKFVAALQHYYELEANAYHFQIETMALLKGRKMVARLKRKMGGKRMEIFLDPDYFT